MMAIMWFNVIPNAKQQLQQQINLLIVQEVMLEAMIHSSNRSVYIISWHLPAWRLFFLIRWTKAVRTALLVRCFTDIVHKASCSCSLLRQWGTHTRTHISTSSLKPQPYKVRLTWSKVCQCYFSFTARIETDRKPPATNRLHRQPPSELSFTPKDVSYAQLSVFYNHSAARQCFLLCLN